MMMTVQPSVFILRRALISSFRLCRQDLSSAHLAPAAEVGHRCSSQTNTLPFSSGQHTAAPANGRVVPFGRCKIMSCTPLFGRRDDHTGVRFTEAVYASAMVPSKSSCFMVNSRREDPALLVPASHVCAVETNLTSVRWPNTKNSTGQSGFS